MERFERIFTARVRIRLIEKKRKLYEITIPKDVAESLGLEGREYVELGIRRVGR